MNAPDLVEVTLPVVLLVKLSDISRDMSKQQKMVLWLSPCFVRRGEVRTARSLVKLGLGRLEDNGFLACNSERWHFTPNDAGRALRALQNQRIVSGGKT